MNELLISFFRKRQVKKICSGLANLLNCDVFVLHKGEKFWYTGAEGETIARILTRRSKKIHYCQSISIETFTFHIHTLILFGKEQILRYPFLNRIKMF